LPDIEAIFVTKDEGIYFTSQALFDRYQSTSDSHTPYVFED
jgi:hypothetical protein